MESVFIRVPYHIGDLERDPIVENYPKMGRHGIGVIGACPRKRASPTARGAVAGGLRGARPARGAASREMSAQGQRGPLRGPWTCLAEADRP